MPKFWVMVKRRKNVRLPWSSESFVCPEVKSQNAVHAAAAGLSRTGWGQADVIEVKALNPAPGRAPLTLFTVCSQGAYGFCYASRVVPDEVQKGGQC